MLNIKDPEIRNLVQISLKNPVFSLKFILVLTTKLTSKFLKIFFLRLILYKRKENYTYFFPNYLRDEQKEIESEIGLNLTSGKSKNNTSEIKKNLINNNKSKYRESKVNKFQDLNIIKLATHKYSFQDTIQWDKKFIDPEDMESLHRWNWLLTKYTETPDKRILAEWGKYHIIDWIEKHSQKIGHSKIWEPYTVSDRICNLIIFSDICNIHLDEYLKNAIRIMANFLFHNLEYYGVGKNFNHIINNARALYFAGQFINISLFTQAAKKILLNELPILITKDGFLREGSSHYQFIFSRWILEILYLSSVTNDREMSSFLLRRGKNLLNKCSFFSVINKKTSSLDIPLIGDVSPDFEPDWIKSLPWSNFAKNIINPGIKLSPNNGYHVVLNKFSGKGLSKKIKYNQIKNKKSAIENSFVENNSRLTFASSGWFRFEFNDIILFIHAHPEGIPPHIGHFHDDIGSFCLYHHGRPLIIDTGRYHYIKDKIGESSKTAQKHNSVQIDDFNPFPLTRYNDFLKKICQRPNISWKHKENQLEIELKHKGFYRIHNDKIVHIRHFVITNSSFKILDRFLGKKRHSVKTFFHLAEGLKLEEFDSTDQLIIKGNQRTYSLLYDLSENSELKTHYGSTESSFGWHYPAYGTKNPIWSLIFDSQTKFPLDQVFIFKWK